MFASISAVSGSHHSTAHIDGTPPSMGRLKPDLIKS